jgi:hypothetical protein
VIRITVQIPSAGDHMYDTAHKGRIAYISPN